jgi:predicted nucleic acid-binding protein
VTVSLDTNILVYAANADDGARSLLAQEIIQRAAVAEGSVLTLQCLAEFVRVVTGKGRMPYDEARRFVDDWRGPFRIHAANVDAFDDAMHIAAAHSLPVFDALLWATARQAGCTTILTEDFQDGRNLGGVTFLNPFDPKNARRLDRVLPTL